MDVGVSVVADAVNPVPEARAGWRDLAARSWARLVVFETVINDATEHRRRVAARTADLVGQRVPSWEQVHDTSYVAWDESRDVARHLIDMSDSAAGLRTVVELLST